ERGHCAPKTSIVSSLITQATSCSSIWSELRDLKIAAGNVLSTQGTASKGGIDEDKTVRVRSYAIDPRPLDPSGTWRGFRAHSCQPCSRREPPSRVPQSQSGGKAPCAHGWRSGAHRVCGDRAVLGRKVFR